MRARPHISRRALAGSAVLGLSGVVSPACGLLAARDPSTPGRAAGASGIAPAARLPTVGFIAGQWPPGPGDPGYPFVEEMLRLGWREGETIRFEGRTQGPGTALPIPGPPPGAPPPGLPPSAARQPPLLPALEELLRVPVAALALREGGAIRAAAAVTKTIPIIMLGFPNDPVADGLAASRARPGANVTGIVIEAVELTYKRLQLLHSALPSVRRVAVLGGPDARDGPNLGRDSLTAAAAQLGVDLTFVFVRSVGDFRPALDDAVAAGAGAVLLMPDPAVGGPFTAQLAAESTRVGVPFVAIERPAAQEGALLTYAASEPALARRAAHITDRILRGANPATIPIEGPSEFELVLNLRTARALGIVLPRSLLIQATDVIQ